MRRTFTITIACCLAVGCQPGTLWGPNDTETGEEERFIASLRAKLGDRGKPTDYDQTLKRQPFAATPLLPTSFNWIKKGIVTKAKNQGSCGSCWAFAVVGVLESKIMIANGSTLDLSEQQQVACNTEMMGCNGGTMKALLYYNADNADKGPMEESCIGYSARDDNCSSMDACFELPYRTTGYYTVHSSSITEIKRSVYADGPAYLRFNVHRDFFSFWRKGEPGQVYQNKINRMQGGHAVLLVGWDDAKQAFLLKNSWGAKKGPNGDGTFWMAYVGHKRDLAVAIANVELTTPGPVCGNGKCEANESGSTCGEDCCDADTPCDQTRQNKGQEFCRSINGKGFIWITEADLTRTYCSSDYHVCKSTYSCSGETHTCTFLPGGWALGQCSGCEGGQASCGDSCVDLSTDESHCGSCDHSCPSGTTCIAGKCGCGAAPGFPEASGTHGEVFTGLNSWSGSTITCWDLMCNDGQWVATGGTSTASYPSCCGSSGGCCDFMGVNDPCPSCLAGQALCGSSCVNLATSESHCGSCNHRCPSGTTCVNGKCGCGAVQGFPEANGDHGEIHTGLHSLSGSTITCWDLKCSDGTWSATGGSSTKSYPSCCPNNCCDFMGTNDPC